MNLALLDVAEAQKPLPECIEDKLEVGGDGDVVVCAFNRRGSMLAGGCTNGTVYVWDFDTHGVAQTLVGHSAKVSSVSWTRSSRRLLSSSADGTLVLWDVLHATATQTISLGGEIAHAAIHPLRRALCLACVSSGPSAGQALLIGLHAGADAHVPLLQPPAESGAAAEGAAPAASAPVATFACFADNAGATTMIGTSRGAVHLLRTESREELLVLRLPGGAAIKSLVISRDGKQFLANSADRVIRSYSIERLLAGERPPPRELQDVVTKYQWSHAGFSSESEHVVGTANSATDHLVYIWDMHGHLAHILGQGEKVKDGALHFACHPTRPILAVCARSGAVYVWTKKYSENWSAFAPDFKELEENEEYAEREDEFDIKPHAELAGQEEEDDELIDIVTVEQTELNHNPDDDDDDEELLFLPTVPEVEGSRPAGADGSGANGQAAEHDGDDGAAKGGAKARAGKRKSLGA